MAGYTAIDGGFELRLGHEVMRVEAWGRDGVRVRIAHQRIPELDHGALDSVRPHSRPDSVTWDGRVATLANGAITARVEATGDGITAALLAAFHDTRTGAELLAEQRQHFAWPGAHTLAGNGLGSYKAVQQFAAYDGERIYGLGQRSHGKLDQKGLSLDLVQRNGEINVPFYYSSRGFGFLWNNPAVGQADFASNHTRWTAEATQAIDYWITAGDTPKDVLARYADVTGHAPQIPAWALGLWQSRLRYTSQAELLDVVREYGRRGWPLSVIVTDFFHWTAMGDWRFDPAEYPDPAAMMGELDAAGVKLMVSVWPTVSPHSENYQALRSAGGLVGAFHGDDFTTEIVDKPNGDVAIGMAFYDATNPAARDFLWDRLKANYWDLGVRVWWLDACEPEIYPADFANLALHAGPGLEVANAYPRDHAQGVYEHAAALGEVVSLARSAWAGGARWGAAVWSGDIDTTWESLAVQVRSGLSIGLAGIPWWTTDIGGFHGGDPDDEAYRELFARWLEFGAFCPLFRLHGYREPRRSATTPGVQPGGGNEPWSYGERVEAIAGDHIALRERLRPYLERVFAETSATGWPVMRPLFLEFPGDGAAWAVDDEFLLGPDLLVAPVLAPGVRERDVYLPAGADWLSAEGTRYPGGGVISLPAPYERIPWLCRADRPDPFGG